jgi:transcriptional regulator with XRE-family HTH domain
VPRIATLADAGGIIRAKRRALGLRIDDAADFSGVSVDLLSRLENGKTGVSTVSLLKVLDALGLAMLILDKRDLPAIPAVARSEPEAPAARPTDSDPR